MQIDVTDEHWAIIAGFLPIEDRRELFALCRALTQSLARKYFFAQCTWRVPPIEWLAAQLLSTLTMKHVVKHVVIEFSWQQAYLAELTALESVHLRYYYSTEETFVVSPLLPVGLKSLTILKCFSFVSVAAVARLVDLEEFSALVRRIDNVEMLGTLPRLRKLTLGIEDDPEADLQWISDLVHLREIRLNDMSIHQGVRLPADKLETFKLRVCDLSSLDFLIEAAPQLTNFSWVNSDLQNIIPKYDKERLLRSLTKIEILRVRRDTLMNSLVPIANLATMKVLEICEMEINDLSALANLVHLEELTVYAPNADWSSIIQCKKLRMIDQGNSFDVQNDSSARALQQLPLLRDLKDPFRMSSKYPLLQITSLEVCYSEDKTFSFEPGCCPNIERLTVLGGNLVVQSVVDNFPMLKKLSCSVNEFVDDLDPLDLLTRLEYLHLDWEQHDTKDMSFLLKMVYLTKLSLRDAKISELSILRNLTQLQHLSIGGDSIEDISVLAELKQLQYLSMYEAPVRDVTCLYGHPHLRVVWLSQPTVCSPLMRVYGKSLPDITFFSHTNCAECLEAFGH